MSAGLGGRAGFGTRTVRQQCMHPEEGLLMNIRRSYLNIIDYLLFSSTVRRLRVRMTNPIRMHMGQRAAGGLSRKYFPNAGTLLPTMVPRSANSQNRIAMHYRAVRHQKLPKSPSISEGSQDILNIPR